MASKTQKATTFPNLVVGRDSGVPTTSTVGGVLLTQHLGAIGTSDTVATAKAIVPNGVDVVRLEIYVTTAFEASAAANVELSIQGSTNLLGTIGVSSVGLYNLTPGYIGVSAPATWLAVSAAAGNVAYPYVPITVRVTSNTTPSGGAATARLIYATVP